MYQILLKIRLHPGFPPLIEILEASVPVSASFIDPAVTVIAPERLLPDAIDTGVMLATERDVTVEFRVYIKT